MLYFSVGIIHNEETHMDQKTYCIVTAVVFFIIALFHLARIFMGWEASLNGWVVPQWISWAGLAVTGFFAYSGFNLYQRWV
jgi:hypothetical protein